MFPERFFQKPPEGGMTPITAITEMYVPPQCPIIVGDVNGYLQPNRSSSDLDLAIQILVATSFENSALYINAGQLEKPTKELVGQTIREVGDRTAIVIPGNGAQSVYRENNLDGMLGGFPRFDVPTERIVENGKVKGVTVSLPQKMREELRKGNIRDIVIIDDVVATGSTLRTLCNNIVGESAIPIQLRAITWFCRRPTDVTGYSSVRSIYQYWSAEGWPALNSLSTWLRGDEKAAAVLTRYKQRFVKKYPYGFDKQLEQIRGLTTL